MWAGPAPGYAMKSPLQIQAPAFIVGTGRCGSTLLSNVLNTNANILSLSEFFRLLTDFGANSSQCFGDEIISAAQFSKLLGTPGSKQQIMLKNGVAMEEYLYQSAVNKTLPALQIVPPVLATTLPHLTSEHIALYGELQTYVNAQEAATFAVHYGRMFEWLRLRFGRKFWVERSGGSLRLLPQLYKAFPHARFVHLVRDGRNAAISMSQHHGFRMLMLGMQLRHEFGQDPYAPGATEITRYIPEKWRGLLPQDFSADAFRAFQVPIFQCGQYWSQEIIAGLRAFEQIPSAQVLTLRYEDFLNAPEQTIARLAFFLDKDIVTVDWIRKAAIKVRSPRSTWTNLDAKERAEIAQACQPGFRALDELYR